MGCKVRMRVSALLLFCCFNVDDVAKRREGSIQHSKMSRPRSGSRPLTSSVASCSPATAILGGGLLLALHLLSEYGLYAMVRFDTFTTASFDQFQSPFNRPAANTPAGILALLCLALLLFEPRTRGRGCYSRLGSGSPREPRRLSLGRWDAPRRPCRRSSLLRWPWASLS